MTTAASAVFLGLASAQAADLSLETAPAPVAEGSAYNWSGFYIGVHGGIGGGTFNHAFTGDPQEIIAPQKALPNSYGENEDITAFGAFGGAQVGYNHQLNPNWVIGVEADLAASGIKAKDSWSNNWNDGEEVQTRDMETMIDWFGTIRGRLGYAMDNLLIYGTGGAAYGSVKTSASYENAWNYGEYRYGDSFSHSDTKFGWTAGAGFEYGVTENITFKTEYLYVDLGSIGISGYNGFLDDTGRTSVDTAFHTLKAGLNYKF